MMDQSANLQAQAMQQGGLMPRQQAKLQAVDEFGNKAPTPDEVMTVMQAGTAQLVNNQAHFTEQLAQAKAILDQARRMGQDANEMSRQFSQPAATQGW